ncbi:DUF6488 family protein [Trichloromonas sp.]|uniref:DUF6488 family protein n=1 Tax=Trichloromonas sp. TaxID=3069249 RepID=UPI003D81A08D
MRKIIISLMTLFALSVGSAFAGAGHDHGPITPISQAEASQKAVGIVAKIVESGKIDASWAEVKPDVAEKKEYQHGPEWLVTFTNPKAEDPAKQTLYVFLSSGGKYLAANFTGK